MWRLQHSQFLRSLFFASGVTVLGTTFGKSPMTMPGIEYTLSVSRSSTDGSQGVAGHSSGYTGKIIWAAGRGRMDVVDGGQPGLLALGDYVLFDSSDYIIVQPRTRTFFKIAMPTSEMLAETGVAMVMSNLHVSLDSLGGDDTVLDRRTEHFRIRTQFTTTVDLRAMGADPDVDEVPGIETETTIDEWVADIPAFPPQPFASMATSLRVPIEGGLAELAAKTAAVRTRIPRGSVTLKRASSTQSSGEGVSSKTFEGMEIRGVASSTVDLSRLVLPSDYVKKVSEAAGLSPGKDSGAKWRTRPNGS